MNSPSSLPSPLFSIGFRPFFLGAGVFAVVSIGLWSMVYLFQFSLPTAPLSVLQWHAHEMIYGYALAVVAGFLLTAVSNWAGLVTSTGRSLMVMFFCWCAARVLYLFGGQFLLLAGLFDLAFLLLLVVSITRPIVAKRLWARMAVVSKVVLLFVFSGVYLLGANGILANGVEIGIYGGFYLIIGLILTVGKNLVPFFIQRGVGYEVTISNFRWLDFLSLGLFLGFFILELSKLAPSVAGVLALALFLVNVLRLGQWHTSGIWGKPLLWGLYLSYCFICLGFLLMGLHYFAGISRYLAIHAFAVGGVSLITLAMMSRVAIGHTGRDIALPPKLVAVSLGLLILSASARVIFPLFMPGLTMLWMQLAFGLWILAYLTYLWVYTPILIGPRVDE
jgi:uncharacterized protein involved in response to NO